MTLFARSLSRRGDLVYRDAYLDVMVGVRPDLQAFNGRRPHANEDIYDFLSPVLG